MKSRNPEWEKYLQFKLSKNKFLSFLGFRFTHYEPGFTLGELDFEEKHEQQNGYLHGGVSSAILDMTCGFASYTLVDEGQQVFTVESKVTYYNKGTSKKYFAEGRVDKAGKRFHFCEGMIYYFENDEKIIVAKCTTTMAVV
jgi:uncharacterized protein (TIGR00369 family)